MKQVRPGRAKPEPIAGHKKSVPEMRRLSADMHRGQRASLGSQTNHAIKAGYKDAADFFATRHDFCLLSGRRIRRDFPLSGNGIVCQD